MAVVWIKTKYPGVRYYEHPTRKHGVNSDRYYTIRYQYDGKTVEEALGWASSGMTPDKANAERSKLKEAARLGEGSRTLKEKREAQVKECAVAEQVDKEQKRQETTFERFFEDVYFPQCLIDKSKESARAERLLFDNWVKPVIGNLPFKQIGIDHLDKIKANMLAGKRAPSKPHPRDRKELAKNAQEKRTPARPLSPRYFNYALAVVRQTWNRACASNPPLAVGGWPGANKAFKKPKVDNQRKRFLSKNEAAVLLQALRKKSQDVHDMALLSLHCGLRAGEIFKLTWDKVSLSKGELVLMDTKNTESRISYLTDDTLSMLRQRSINCQHKRLVFATTIKEEPAPYSQVPVTFSRTVKELGLNEGVTDSRGKVVFHSLRHTYASWLVDHGASLPTIRDLLGHKNLIMTSRYSHPTAEAQKEAVAALNRSMKATGDNVVNLEQKRNNRKE